MQRSAAPLLLMFLALLAFWHLRAAKAGTTVSLDDALSSDVFGLGEPLDAPSSRGPERLGRNDARRIETANINLRRVFAVSSP